jgi:hypothetical protein
VGWLRKRRERRRKKRVPWEELQDLLALNAHQFEQAVAAQAPRRPLVPDLVARRVSDGRPDNPADGADDLSEPAVSSPAARAAS